MPVTLPAVVRTRLGCSQWRMVTPLLAASSCSKLEAGDLAELRDDALGLQPVADGDALGRREILLEPRSVHVLLAAAVDNGDFLRAEQLRLHRRVDRRHAAANHNHPAADG